ncbi:MAG TPA: endonuclease [Prolixibacteraceae bacterium]
MRLITIFWVLLFFLPPKNCFSQENSVKNEFTLMFYNTENFYDSENDSLTNDDEFTSEGDRRWTSGRMHTKAERLGKVILAAGKWNPPVFVGLCEIENLQVLELLTGIAPLNKYRYKIIQKDSRDERGIDVAFIYRPDLFKPFDYEAIPMVDPNDKSFRTRDILRVSGVLNQCDTLHVFVNHWPSRYGGMMETMKYRRLAAETLKKAVQRLKSGFSAAKIICMGDFNDTPTDESIARVFDAKESDNPEIKGEMINLSSGWLSNPVQTIKSQYNWEVFDQWIVSDYFLENKGCFKFLKAEIFDAGFLLETDSKFGGVKPKRNYVGYKYQEGFSDHLPVLLRFQILNH